MFIMVMKEIEILCFLCFAQPFENLTKLLWKFDNNVGAIETIIMSVMC